MTWYDKDRPYAFRTFPKGSSPVRDDTSSAEWHEGTALELGDRVSEAGFFQMMYQAYACVPWAGQR